MKSRTMLLVAALAIATPAMAFGQHRHRKVTAQTVGHPALQHSVVQHGPIQKGGGCGCDAPVSHGCCRPCCPPIIPAILNHFDRTLKCLFPCHRYKCGGCKGCGYGGMKYDGCCNGAVGPGVPVPHAVPFPAAAPQTTPLRATPLKPTQAGSYYDRRGAVTPRYQPTRSRVQRRPVPARTTSTPAAKPAPARTTSTDLKRVDADLVRLQKISKRSVRTVGYDAPHESRVRNPLRD